MVDLILGCIATLIGLLGAVFRRKLAALSHRVFAADEAETSTDLDVSLERGFAIGGCVMALAGAVTVVYALVSGS